MNTCKPEQEGEDMVAKRKSEKDKSEKEMTVCPLPLSSHIRQSRPDYGLGVSNFQANVLKAL